MRSSRPLYDTTARLAFNVNSCASLTEQPSYQETTITMLKVAEVGWISSRNHRGGMVLGRMIRGGCVDSKKSNKDSVSIDQRQIEQTKEANDSRKLVEFPPQIIVVV